MVSSQPIKNIAEFKEKIEESLNLSKNTSEVLEIILRGTIDLEASDLHFEPQKEKTKIRVRIDGLLQEVLSIDKKSAEALIGRIKLLAKLKLNTANRPQDGRFSIVSPDGLAIEIRVSALPAENGETLVLRILNPKALIEVEELGLPDDSLAILKKEFKKPNGMIIVTGPTGSGKTTTLYAFLKRIQTTEIKIITIEDPIEYHLKDVSQTQVKEGYDFASGLKSIMRQDPDVILVGEIRDLETVQTALQAALTGHLVLTTLHTNDATGTVARLIALGAAPSNIGPAVNLVVAQRLVRKVCPKCRLLRKLTAQELSLLKAELKKVPQNIKIPQAKGCAFCNFTGYKGRIGIFEILLIDDEIEKLILVNPAMAALRDLAVKRGMVTLKQDGLRKVLKGLTTLEEVERVVG
ncbi:MAG: hypothetical protein A2896_00950 [Candidatus Nealsonbacteria bacterium RIFCSPLOWO2_01_FULL_43_32]|uniref:Bacterial type II secretion system protein E domain-containing protein n=1 Tax=Candidatus Nealsonbacteria bacterium RIFCSPLOWO2_01_FULL_43_32 TaxID=1801672 RepID=A0A1G2EEZ5_9BACT|nr:MAG: hypothetical protein A2896_00950 [Candidatus Nealsonbacteria bacterium RIFCSPLOWO2_01_FULL_43_32]